MTQHKHKSSLVRLTTLLVFLLCAVRLCAQVDTTVFVYQRCPFADLQMPTLVMIVARDTPSSLKSADAIRATITLTDDGEYITSPVTADDYWYLFESSQGSQQYYLATSDARQFLLFDKANVKTASTATRLVYDEALSALKHYSENKYLYLNGNRWQAGSGKNNATALTFYQRHQLTLSRPQFSVHTVECGNITTLQAPTLHYIPDESHVTYASSNPLVATIDHDGQLQPLRNGNTTITAHVTTHGITLTTSYRLTINDPTHLAESVDIIYPSDLTSVGTYTSPLTSATYSGLANRQYITLNPNVSFTAQHTTLQLHQLYMQCYGDGAFGQQLLLYTDDATAPLTATLTATTLPQLIYTHHDASAIHSFTLRSSTSTSYSSITVVWRCATVDHITSAHADADHAVYDLAGRRTRPTARHTIITNRRKHLIH